MVYIYVLKLESEKYYIGKTDNPNFTLDAYNSQDASSWTIKFKPTLIHQIIPDQSDNDEERIIQEYKNKYGIDNVRGGCEEHNEELIPVTEEGSNTQVSVSKPSENIRGEIFVYAAKKLGDSAYKYAFSLSLSEKIMAFIIQSSQIALYFGIALLCSTDYAEIDEERDPMQMSILLFVCFQITIMFIVNEAITCFSTCSL